MAKGFRLPQRTALLVFDGDYQGAEVRVKLDVPIGLMMRFMDLQSTPADAKAGLEVYRLFSEAILLSWNLENEDGQAIPCTAEGMKQITPTFANLILTKWTEVAQNPPDPLSRQSTNGRGSAEPTITTVIGSASPGNLPAPN